ncbi:MAG: XRN 5'-3' exonuclease [Dasosvirus sp.]|uniref:XRN 5'-3' exonuclease n=1 Tax=Dasosvirus sp. TaxID=2487764 RepID=A0A3G4ZRM3_9VIRU|nr:MAG: XRN 5'-3' exonuclease [Dasosvirus sp.]
MGVPSFYRLLTKKYRGIVKSNPDRKIKSLYIDANCLFHPQCFKILDLYQNVTDPEKLFKLMSGRILRYIEYLINLCNPEDLVYIAVDGVAPLAKIKQQRSRRFGYADNYKHRIYRKHRIAFNDSWSNIVITPGTEFMYNLHHKIKTFLEQKQFSCKLLIYDSYFTAGEGEHKILQHIKRSRIIDLNDPRATVIYGLDADLIFLSIASKCDHIYLLREADQFNHTGEEIKSNSNDVATELLYADIDFTKQCIDREFDENREKFDQFEQEFDESGINKDIVPVMDSKKQFTDDYIFICYFLGNDFLPHLPSIDIAMDGIKIVTNAYLDT